MPKTVDQIRQQIAKLQQQEQAILAKEIDGVVAKIKTAVKHYGITPEQIFGSDSVPSAKAPSAAKTTKPKTVRAAAPMKAESAEDGAAPSKHASVPKGTKLVAKYSDDAGNSWTGRGSQPRWLRAAIEAGKKIEDFLIP